MHGVQLGTLDAPVRGRNLPLFMPGLRQLCARALSMRTDYIIRKSALCSFELPLSQHPMHAAAQPARCAVIRMATGTRSLLQSDHLECAE